MVLAYAKMGREIALNVENINSFCLPHLIEASAFRMLGVCFALVMGTKMAQLVAANSMSGLFSYNTIVIIFY